MNATQKTDLSGLVRRLATGLAEARAKGKAMWFVGGAKQRFAVHVTDRKDHLHVAIEWYRPEAMSDDDFSRGGMLLPPASGLARMAYDIDVPTLDDPAVVKLLRRIPDIHARTLAAWYPA
jgi:hypothetical protein